MIQSGVQSKNIPRLAVRFYREASGSEPVREWLKSLPHDEKREIGTDIKTVQFGWPMGMPLVRHVEKDIWEVRNRLPTRIARVLFTLEGDEMILLHGFIKKDRKTPKPDLDLARRRLRKLRSAS